MKKDVLKNYAKFTGTHLRQSLFLIEAYDCNFAKKILWHRCSRVNFAKFSRTPFLQNTSGRLLLYVKYINCKNNVYNLF